MEQWIADQMRRWQHWRSKQFAFLGRFFLKSGITANRMTFFSFIFGLASVYFLFLNHTYFIILAALHLLADGLDGIIARVSAPTQKGMYADTISDQLIHWLIIIKIGFFYKDYYVLIIAALLFLAQAIYLTSKLTAPFLPARTLTLLLVAISVPTIAYLTSGIAAAYSLARQLQWIMEKRRGI